MNSETSCSLFHLGGVRPPPPFFVALLGFLLDDLKNLSHSQRGNVEFTAKEIHSHNTIRSSRGLLLQDSRLLAQLNSPLHSHPLPLLTSLGFPPASSAYRTPGGAAGSQSEQIITVKLTNVFSLTTPNPTPCQGTGSSMNLECISSFALPSVCLM